MTTKDGIKAGAWTSLWVFIVLFLVSLLGWLAQVAAWAGSEGVADFPQLSTLAYAVVAAFVAALTGLVNAIVRIGQSKGIIPGNGPVYDTTAVER